MPPPELRPYQREAIDAVLQARRQGVRRMVISLPTGAGKTVIFAHLCKLARRPVLVLAHREELLGQARDKIANALGDPAAVAIEQGQQRAPAEARVVVASIRSLHAERLERVLSLRTFGLVLYDECHHAPAEDNCRVLQRLGAFDPSWDGTLVGLTATTARGDGQGLDRVFQQIVYARTLPQMIADKWLVPLRGLRVTTRTDLRGVLASGDDLDVEALQEAVDVEERNALVARAIQELARDRRTLVFCAGVGHAVNLCKALNKLGVPTDVVWGAMDPARRVQALHDFRTGRVQALTNVAVLTEGFDDPGVGCVAMARPTRSEGLYAQCVGRGTRLHPGKDDCLVLDFVDLSDLSLCSLPSLYGLPRQLDLQGEEADAAAKRWERILFDHPHFEAEAGAITLDELERRAAAFDPLTRQVDPTVRAVSPLGWLSLGSAGLALHWQPRPGQWSEVLVVRSVGRGRRWEARMEGKPPAKFGTLEEAVQAVDYEIEQRGRRAWSSAVADAAWRQAGVPRELAMALRELRPPRQARSLGEALALLALAKHGPVGGVLQGLPSPDLQVD